MSNLSLPYPIWTLALCALGALLFAMFLYARYRRYDEKGAWIRPLLAFLRWSAVALIGFLLLGPLIKTILTDSKEPVIALVIDRSQSVSETTDQASWNIGLQNMAARLQEKYQVDIYSFDQDINTIESVDSISYDGQLTNLSRSIEYIGEIYEGENLGAVVLASDGIYNEGKSPIYAKYNSLSPIHTIALGDTTRRKDAIAKRVLYNSVAYLNDEMSTQLDVQGFNANSERVRISISKINGDQSTELARQNVTLRGDNDFHTVTFDLAMDQAGINHYRYRVSPLTGESNRSNNVKDIYIEVLDARQNIGIIAGSPHPDISALKQLLEQNKNYEVSIFSTVPSASEVDQLDLAILHQLPSSERNIAGTLSRLNTQKTPRIFVLGPLTNITAFNANQSDITIRGTNGSVSDAQASLDSRFASFTLSDRVKQVVPTFPPMKSPFGQYEKAANLQVLLNQNIGGIETDYPLVAFSDKDGIKSGYILGTDIWRWKLFEYLQEGNFDVISELLDKVTIYTSTKEDKRKFRVNSVETIYNENDEVQFQAELYNNSYELTNDPDVFMTITDQSQNKYEYTFSKNSTVYSLDAGKLARGRYSYVARTNYNGEQYEVSGRFTVRDIQYELYDLEARHNVLYSLSEKFNGKVYYPEQMEELGTQILDSDVLKPVLYQSQVTRPLLDKRWIFGLVALILALEWLLRRYFGSL